MSKVQVTYTYISQFIHHSSFSSLLRYLPHELHADILRYKFEPDQYARAIGKYLLLKQLEALGYPSEVLKDLTKDAYEKPVLKGIPLSFNIAHSQDLVVCAVSTECQIGIDVEYIKPIERGLFKDQFTPSEWHKIEEDDSLHAFYNHWTRKESVIKADGRGLQIPLQTIDTTQAVIQIRDTLTHWYLQALLLDQAYKAHLCSDSNVNRVVIQKLVPNV